MQSRAEALRWFTHMESADLSLQQTLQWQA